LAALLLPKPYESSSLIPWPLLVYCAEQNDRLAIKLHELFA